MKRKFTLLIAALALLTMIVQPGRAWGQESYSITYDVTAIGNMFASGSSYESANGYWKVPASAGNSAQINIPITYQPDSDITITFRIATFGSGTNPSASNTTITAIGTETNSNWSGTGVSSYPSSSTYVNGVMTISKPQDPTTLGGLAITMGVNSGIRIFRLQSIAVEYTYSTGGGDLEDSDLAIVDDPVVLDFNLYPTAIAQTVTYTTSSTGAVTVSESEYVTTSVSGYTITVTPVAVTPSAQTITVSQAADATYAAGSATFTVNVTNSAPTVTVTYHANGGEGENIVATPYQGSDYTVANNTFTKSGYAFTKWHTNAAGTGGTDYDPGDVIENISDNIDLYAQWEESSETTYDFTQIEGFSSWGNGYSDHEVEYSDATVTFYASSHQTGTITNQPVTKAGPVTLIMTDGSTLNGVTFNLTQWTTKTKTVELHYSTDGGDSYTSTTITSSNFTITSNSLPAGTNAVKITFSEASNQVGIASATVVKNNVSDPRTPTTTSINVPDGFNTDIYINTTAGTLTASVYAGETLLDGATVTWASSNTTVATVDSNGAVTLVGVGNTNITADYAGDETNYKPSQGVYQLSVTSSEPVPGTVNNPYTVAQARAAIDAGTGTQGVYATGIVCTASPQLYSGGKLSYYISADGLTTSDQLEAYNGLGINGEPFTSVDDVQVGDIVVIYGNLTKYNSTYEFAANNRLYSLVRKNITVDPTSINLSYITGNGPDETDLTITGTGLTQSFTATITQEGSYFEMTDGTNTGTSLTIPAEGDLITVRLKAGLSHGDYTGTLTMHSEELSNDVVVALTGSVTNQTYDIVVTQPATGGTIAADKEYAEAGATVTLTANPEDAYNFGSWSVFRYDMETPITVENNQFIMPDCDVLVTATFTAKPTYAITCVATPDNTGLLVSTPESAYEGQTVTLEYTPETGYGLSSIVITKTEDGSATGITPTASGDDYTFVMPGYAVTATATFEEFVDYVTLPFEWEGGTTAELSDNTGVTVSSGGDYGDTHAPYQVKFNNEGNYIQIKTDSQIETVSVGVKKIGGAPVSKIIIKESADGTNFEEVETFELEGAQNAILNLETSNEFDASTRFIQIYFNRTGQNVGVGPITITKFSTEPVINAENVNLAYDATSGEIGYTITRPVTGITLEASTTADWISDIQVTEEKVTFNTTPNEGEEDRVATFTLSYTGAENKEVTVTQAHFVVDFATLPFEFTGGYNDIDDVVGFTYDGLGGYTSSVTTKLKFDDEGDWLILKLNEAPTSLSYDIKGNGTSSDGTFSVQTSVNGVDYEDLVVYTTSTLNNIIKTFTYVDFDPEVRYIKWIYTYRANGNIGLGNIRASENYDIYGNCTVENLTVNPTEILTVYAGSVMTVGTLTNNSGADNLIIEDGGQLVFSGTDVQATVKKRTVGEAKDDMHWYTIASPVTNKAFTEVTNLVTASAYDLYRYNEGEYKWENYKSTEPVHSGFNTGDITSAFEAGRGYLYYNADGSELSFAGTLNNDEVSCNVTASHNGINLIGNPFTQNITLDNIEGTISAGGYVLNNANDWSADPNPTIQPCEGFIVEVADEQNITIQKTPSSKSRANRDYIALTVANSEYEDVTYALFSDGMGLSKINHRNADIPMLYIPQNDKNYAIATMDDNTQAFNLNFKAMTTGQYTLSFKAQGSYSYLHVIDRITGEDIDMLLDDEYTFIGSPRDNENRFIVKLNYNANIDELEAGDSFAYQYGNGIIVNGKGELQVFDVNGRMVMNTVINGKQTVNVPTTGLYIFRMVGESVKTQKIVVR